MKNTYLRIITSLFTLVIFSLNPVSVFSQEKFEELDRLFSYYSENARFSGVVLASVNGKVIFHKAYGFSSYANKTKMDTSCVFNIASITKPFTAAAIMMLKERGLLSYEDKLVKYLPGFPSYAKDITIRHLLTHTSGLPDYQNEMHLEQSAREVTSGMVFDSLICRPSLDFSPGSEYSYSNTGYFLLALIIEKISGMSYREFMISNIFKPLGMKQTYAYDESVSRIPFRVESYSGFWQINEDDLVFKVPGDGNVYSTASDLFLFDQALFDNKLVKHETMAEAFDTSHLFSIKKNGLKYGLGWNILQDTGGIYVYHTGALGGFRCQFWRDICTRNSLIILGNNTSLQFNSGIITGAQRIMKGDNYILNNISITEMFYDVYHSDGFGTAIKQIKETWKKRNSIYNFNEIEINNLGLDLLFFKNEPLNALEILKFNAELFPGSWNAFDSLGEIYLQIGEDKLARISFERSLELNPQNASARSRLSSLNK